MVMNKTIVWSHLENLSDPEIPVVSLVEMGIVRDVLVTDKLIKIIITPTFSGCPALHEIKKNIKEEISKLGVERIEIEVTYAPPWTTDWIQDSARVKLKEIGLMPPKIHHGDFLSLLIDPVACPYCNSNQTTLKNSFGATPCRMIYYCNNCVQPFEFFKPL